MLDIFSKYATDETLENNGAVVSIGGGATLKVARHGNKAYVRLLAKLYDQHRAVLEARDDAADAKSDEVMAEVIAKTILLGWEGVSYKGKPLPYSTENAKMLLKHQDFRRMVMEHAEKQEHFLLKEEAEQGEI